MSIAVVYKMRKKSVFRIHIANMTDARHLKMEQMTHFNEVKMSCMSLRCDCMYQTFSTRVTEYVAQHHQNLHFKTVHPLC